MWLIMELVAKLLCLKIEMVKWGLTRFQVGNRGCCHASPLESKLWRAPWRQRPLEENHPAFQVMLSGTSAQVPVNGEDKENFWRQNVLTVQVLVLWTTSHTNMDHFFGDKHSAIVPEKLDSNYIFGQISFHQNSCCKSILQIYPEEYSRLSALGPEPAPPWGSLDVTFLDARCLSTMISLHEHCTAPSKVYPQVHWTQYIRCMMQEVSFCLDLPLPPKVFRPHARFFGETFGNSAILCFLGGCQ